MPKKLTDLPASILRKIFNEYLESPPAKEHKRPGREPPKVSIHELQNLELISTQMASYSPAQRRKALEDCAEHSGQVKFLNIHLNEFAEDVPFLFKLLRKANQGHHLDAAKFVLAKIPRDIRFDTQHELKEAMIDFCRCGDVEYLRHCWEQLENKKYIFQLLGEAIAYRQPKVARYLIDMIPIEQVVAGYQELKGIAYVYPEPYSYPHLIQLLCEAVDSKPSIANALFDKLISTEKNTINIALNSLFRVIRVAKNTKNLSQFVERVLIILTENHKNLQFSPAEIGLPLWYNPKLLDLFLPYLDASYLTNSKVFYPQHLPSLKLFTERVTGINDPAQISQILTPDMLFRLISNVDDRDQNAFDQFQKIINHLKKFDLLHGPNGLLNSKLNAGFRHTYSVFEYALHSNKTNIFDLLAKEKGEKELFKDRKLIEDIKPEVRLKLLTRAFERSDERKEGEPAALFVLDSKDRLRFLINDLYNLHESSYYKILMKKQVKSLNQILRVLNSPIDKIKMFELFYRFVEIVYNAFLANDGSPRFSKLAEYLGIKDRENIYNFYRLAELLDKFCRVKKPITARECLEEYCQSLRERFAEGEFKGAGDMKAREEIESKMQELEGSLSPWAKEQECLVALASLMQLINEKVSVLGQPSTGMGLFPTPHLGQACKEVSIKLFERYGKFFEIAMKLPVPTPGRHQ